MTKFSVTFAAFALFGLVAAPAVAQDMTFFLTSEGPGQGANLGGLAGADAHCEKLASSAGAGSKTWHAYLSTDKVSAKDRIGSGPWHNAKGVKVADSVADLHLDNNKLSKENSISEKGAVLNGRGDEPNKHDVLTGSNLDGTLFSDGKDHTCSNWTGTGEGSAEVGHHDRQGGGANPTSWNAAHGSRGCTLENLIATGGNGHFYCFAID